MFFKNKAYAPSCILASLCVLLIQNSWANTDQLSSFQDIVAKVQYYHSQNELQLQRQAIAEFNQQNSRLWQNPSLAITQDGFGSNQEQEFTIEIRQPLDVFGQRKIEEQIASNIQQQLELKERLWRVQSELIVKHIWSQYLLSETEITILAQQVDLSQASLDSAKKRYQAGSIALVEYERAQIAYLDTQRQLQQARLIAQSAQRQLSNLWGEPQPTFKLDLQSLTWPNDSERAVQQNIGQGWLEQLYQLNLQQSNAQIERLKRSNRPQPTLNVGMTKTKTPQQSPDTTMALGVEVPLAIFNRQQYRIPIAEHQQRMLAQLQHKDLQQQILDIANRLNELKALRQQYDAIATQIQLAEKVHSRTLLGFQAGKLSITDVQQTAVQLQGFRLAQLYMLKQAWQIALASEALSVGMSDEEMTQSNAYSKLSQSAFADMQSLINTQGE